MNCKSRAFVRIKFLIQINRSPVNLTSTTSTSLQCRYGKSASPPPSSYTRRTHCSLGFIQKEKKYDVRPSSHVTATFRTSPILHTNLPHARARLGVLRSIALFRDGSVCIQHDERARLALKKQKKKNRVRPTGMLCKKKSFTNVTSARLLSLRCSYSTPSPSMHRYSCRVPRARALTRTLRSV